MRRHSRSLVLAFAALSLFATRSALADESTMGANVSVPPAPAHFRLGYNPGYTPGWTNPQKATIASKAGSTSIRIAMSEQFFTMWGYDIIESNGDMAGYSSNGLGDITAFVNNMIPAHSNAPANTDTATYSPTNLYEPIWTSPGVVNPNNWWAVFMSQTVTQYKGQVKVWEIWNEPDFSPNFNATMIDWWTSPPTPSDLTNWHDSIYSYIRLLRISYEVAKAIDPDCFIAVGGLGYESYLDAIARYTDNPTDGSVTDDYPAHGGTWFDALSFHHYPMYGVYDDATKTWNLNTDSDSMADNFAVALSNMTEVLTAHGYDGTTHPRKVLLSTETGLADVMEGTNAGGPVLMRNYMAKFPVTALANGMFQAHWFDLNDGSDETSSDPYQHMGMYYAIDGQTPDNAMRKPPVAAYGTASIELAGASFDAASTAALALDPSVKGYVFRLDDGTKRYALWAKTSPTSETAAATVMLPTTVSLIEEDWDAFDTKTKTTHTPSGGAVSLDLDGSPRFFTESTATDPAGAGGGPGAGGSSSGTGGTATGGNGTAGMMGTGGSGTAGGDAQGGTTSSTGGSSSSQGGTTSHGGTGTSTGGTSTGHAGTGALSTGGAAGKGTGGATSHGGTAAAHAGATSSAGGSSTAGAGGVANADATDASSGDSSGCGCRVANPEGSKLAGLGAALALGVLARRRKRSASAPDV